MRFYTVNADGSISDGCGVDVFKRFGVAAGKMPVSEFSHAVVLDCAQPASMMMLESPHEQPVFPFAERSDLLAKKKLLVLRRGETATLHPNVAPAVTYTVYVDAWGVATTTPVPSSLAATDDERAIIAWGKSGGDGMSSLSIAHALFPAVAPAPSTDSLPRDADDVLRCERLMQAVPSIRSRFAEVYGALPNWKPLLTNWQELSASAAKAQAGDKQADARVRDLLAPRARAEETNELDSLTPSFA
jgi:hypothetical protein